jgi:hypothetical protein
LLFVLAAAHDLHQPLAQLRARLALLARLVLREQREAAAARRTRQHPGHAREQFQRRELVVHLEALRPRALAAADRDPFHRRLVVGGEIVGIDQHDAIRSPMRDARRIGEGDAHRLEDDAVAGEAEAFLALFQLRADGELHLGPADQLGRARPRLAARIAGADRRRAAIEIDDVFEHEAAMALAQRRDDLGCRLGRAALLRRAETRPVFRIV